MCFFCVFFFSTKWITFYRCMIQMLLFPLLLPKDSGMEFDTMEIMWRKAFFL